MDVKGTRGPSPPAVDSSRAPEDRVTHLADVVASLRHNRGLARMELGFLLSTVVEWSAWLALVVIAFGQGGAAEAGLVGFAVGAPALVVAPTAAILGDRWPRSRVLLGAYLGEALALLAAAVAFSVGAPLLGYALGIVAMAIIGLIRPLLASVLPELARSPEELTAANVVTGLGEGGGALLGPLIAGVLFGLVGPAAVLVAGAAAILVAAGAIVEIAVRARSIERDALRAPDADARHAAGAIAHELAAGAATILADRRLAVVTGLMAATIGVLGALNVLIVVVAIDVLGLDEQAAGYLTAASGVGALLGSALASSLVGRERLAAPLLGAVATFGIAVAVVGLGDEPVRVALALVATGVGWSIAVVAATTLTQRLAGDDVMTRVFGVNEALQTGSEAVGGLLVPILVATVAPVGALLVLGIGLALVVGVAAPILLRADRVEPAFLRDLARVRAVPAFAPLSGPVLERLAAGASHVTVPAGATIVREGEPGDRFYVVISGEGRVSARGRDAGTLLAGASFGEIALLRDVPRTATVVARDEGDLLPISGDPFLEALTGQPRRRAMAVGVVAGHLARGAWARAGP